MLRKKVTFAGAGNVGATIARRIVNREIANVVMVDVVEGLPQGKPWTCSSLAQSTATIARSSGPTTTARPWDRIS